VLLEERDSWLHHITNRGLYSRFLLIIQDLLGDRKVVIIMVFYFFISLQVVVIFKFEGVIDR
jgi:hypothetical protein